MLAAKGNGEGSLCGDRRRGAALGWGTGSSPRPWRRSLLQGSSVPSYCPGKPSAPRLPSGLPHWLWPHSPAERNRLGKGYVPRGVRSALTRSDML